MGSIIKTGEIDREIKCKRVEFTKFPIKKKLEATHV